MKPGPPWETNSRSDTTEFPKILWNPKVHYGVHERSPLVSNLTQTNPVRSTPPYFSKIRFNIILPPTSVFLAVPFLLIFPPKPYMQSSSLPCVYQYLVFTTAVPYCKRLVASFPLRQPRFDPRKGYAGLVVDHVALGLVFSEYFGFPCQFSFLQLLHIH
jgi:hypothetical protein